jgi:hypothetical protein
MKIVKRQDNVTDDNDKEVCLFKLTDLRIYVANLKRYLSDERNEFTVAQSQSIATEVEAWAGFRKIIKQQSTIINNLKSKEVWKTKNRNRKSPL